MHEGTGIFDAIVREQEEEKHTRPHIPSAKGLILTKMVSQCCSHFLHNFTAHICSGHRSPMPEMSLRAWNVATADR